MDTATQQVVRGIFKTYEPYEMIFCFEVDRDSSKKFQIKFRLAKGESYWFYWMVVTYRPDMKKHPSKCKILQMISIPAGVLAVLRSINQERSKFLKSSGARSVVLRSIQIDGNTVYGKKRPKMIRQPILEKCGALDVVVLRNFSDEDEEKKSYWMLKARKELEVCPFVFDIIELMKSKNYRRFFMFALNSSGVIVAGLAAKTSPASPGMGTIYVSYLCSAKTCRGAGSALVKYIERYAADGRIDPSVKRWVIELHSDKDAVAFYNKTGWFRDSTRYASPVTRSKFRRSHLSFSKIVPVSKK